MLSYIIIKDSECFNSIESVTDNGTATNPKVPAIASYMALIHACMLPITR